MRHIGWLALPAHRGRGADAIPRDPDDPSRIERFDARFSSPVYLGETIATRIWRDGRDVAFECLVAERGATVIRNGYCRLRN